MILSLQKRGLTHAEIAAHLNASGAVGHLGQPFTVASVCKRIGRAKRSKPKAAPTGAEEQWLRLRADEGIPATWLAESISNRSVWSARRIASEVTTETERASANLEWKRVWSGIRHNEELYALHQEFAPRKGKHDNKREDA